MEKTHHGSGYGRKWKNQVHSSGLVPPSLDWQAGNYGLNQHRSQAKRAWGFSRACGPGNSSGEIV